VDDAGERVCIAIPPGGGRLFWALTDWALLKLEGRDTRGKLSIVEQSTLPQSRPPLHRHTFDEVHYVLEGEYEYYEEGKAPRRASAGAIFFAPGGVVHTYKNVGSTPGRVLAIYSPPGFEDFYPALNMPAADMSSPPLPANPIDVPKTVLLLMEQYGTELMEPVSDK
jgi:quercetin dioxygenase-like cupin family protein